MSDLQAEDQERFIVASDVNASFQELCIYNNREASHLIIVDSPNARIISAPSNKLTHSFRVLDPGPVSLRGFRAFTDDSGYFFTDESLDSTWNGIPYKKRFADGVLYEDYRAQFVEENVLLPPLVKPVEITEPVVCLCSAEPANYGSWLFRILPKLASLPEDEKALFIYARSQWQLDLLQLFAPRREVIQHKPTLNYRLLNAQLATMRNQGVYFDEQTKAFYREACAQVQGKSNIRKIYLARGGHRIRPMLNEMTLEEHLAGLGYEIVYPEKLSLKDRILVIRDAEIIVCPGGSGLFNLVFAQNARLVVDIEPNNTWIHAHGRLMESLCLPHAIFFGHPAEQGSPHAPWFSPIDEVLNFIRLH